jgi:Rha family phage regulatory protein
MHELTLIRQNGGAYIDSREVAEVIGKRHHHLLRDIDRYIRVMEESIETNFGFNDFFLESSYVDSIGRTLPCYLLSKMGCEMVANKLTGEKGVLFTAAYVSKFNEMEQRERAELEALIEISQRPEPRLGEINACARIIVRGMKDLGATPERIIEFLKETYEPLGFTVAVDTGDEAVPHWHTAGEIAKRCGLYSLYGKPHSQAAACILNENIFIGEEHKRVVTENYGAFTSVSIRYDDFALCQVVQWLVENGLPDEIYGFERTYHVQYQD